LDEAIAGQSEQIRDFVKSRLRNDATYNDRMVELASIPDSEAVDKLLTDRVQWAERLKNSRHDLAHANERPAQTSDSVGALCLLETTYALLCLVAMAEIGLSAEVQRRAVSDTGKINWAAAQFKKLLASRDALGVQDVEPPPSEDDNPTTPGELPG
jgi:hypothetical protein